VVFYLYHPSRTEDGGILLWWRLENRIPFPVKCGARWNLSIWGPKK
jgi:hypothetical protein